MPSGMARLAAVLIAAALPGCGMSPPLGRGVEATAVQVALARSAPGDAIAAFYRARGYRPLWIKGREIGPEARELLNMLARAGADGIDPARYDVPRLALALDRADGGDADAVAAAEILLSRVLADHVIDLHIPSQAAAPAFVDPQLPSSAETRAAVLRQAARAPSLRTYLRTVRRMNPVYEGLRRGLAAYTARWGSLPETSLPERPLAQGMGGTAVGLLRERLGLSEPSDGKPSFDAKLAAAVRSFQTDHGLQATGKANIETIRALNLGPSHYRHLIRLNLDRARALPANPGRRYILVNTATASLHLYEGSQPTGEMRVIIGKQDQQTPVLAGLIRFAVLKPYWNVPPDIARDRVAAHFAREGAAYFKRERFEIMSDWSDEARPLDPGEVDWKAVAAGQMMLRVRQLPGPHNMMGTVKFMLPNPLGIYLHDTPDKSGFALADRRLSSGCVRVEDAPRLLSWLFRGAAPAAADDVHDQHVDLPDPVPVYIVYLTAVPGPDGVRFHDDIYGRDVAQI